MCYFENAVAYVRENVSPSEISRARGLIKKEGYDLWEADEHLADEIHDLLEEYSDEHFLPEEWWRSYGDEEDILKLL